MSAEADFPGRYCRHTEGGRLWPGLSAPAIFSLNGSEYLSRRAAAVPVKSREKFFSGRSGGIKFTGKRGSAGGAAAEAAKAASEAATAAQSRPNVTQQNTYNVTVQAPAQPGALEMGAALDKALRDRERQKDADLRGSFLGQPKY